MTSENSKRLPESKNWKSIAAIQKFISPLFDKAPTNLLVSFKVAISLDGGEDYKIEKNLALSMSVRASSQSPWENSTLSY